MIERETAFEEARPDGKGVKKEATLNIALLQKCGWISSADAHFARFCAEPSRELAPKQVVYFEMIVAALSRFLRAGHSCVPLSALADLRVLGESGEFVGCFPSLQDIEGSLNENLAVTWSHGGTPGAGLSGKVDDGSAPTTPLVLDQQGRLYVSRYFEHEQRLAGRLAQLVRGKISDVETHLDAQWLESRLDYYFPPQSKEREPLQGGGDLQRSAAELALRRCLAVISGGPGTGKTSTVVKILALLFEKAEHEGQTLPVVQLLAPTGKAAARMMEAIASASEKLVLSPQVKAAMVGEASTIHRALGVIPNNSSRFFRGPQQLLLADIVLVDEASMVDLALMRHLVGALKEGARLILLGDRYQLASVEAGSVLSELCGVLSRDDKKRRVGLDKGEPERVFKEISLAFQSTVELKKSYRFSEESGIYCLAACIRKGEGRDAIRALTSNRKDLHWGGELPNPGESIALRKMVLRSYGKALKLGQAHLVLRALDEFRILCAHRQGKHGVESVNEQVRMWLAGAGAVARTGEFYKGRPLLITQNDHTMGLHNGDIGIIWPNDREKLVAFFPGKKGEMREVSPAQLPKHETAFALTVHKSQGSEYDEVVVILPDASSPLLTRELVYTAVTRARVRVELFGSAEALITAAGRSVVRFTGLGDALAELL